MTIPYTKTELIEFLKQCRQRKLLVNPGLVTELGSVIYYGAPVLNVIDSEWMHLADRPWDHSLESIEECAELAALQGGWVSVVYPIIIVDPHHMNLGETIDDGFEVRVWPTMALRVHNEFVELEEESEEDHGV